MKQLFQIIFFLLLSLSFSIANAAPIEKSSEKEIQGTTEGATAKLTVRVSSGEISVAESLDLTIEVSEPNGITVNFPSFNELGFATDFTERSQRFRVTDISKLTRQKQADGSSILSQRYTLEPFLSGDYAILPIMVTFQNSDQKTPSSKLSQWRAPLLSLMTDGIRVKVTPLPADRRDLSDLLGQVDLELASLLEKERRTENKSDQELHREEEEKNEAAAALKERRFPWWIIWILLALITAVPIGWYLGRKKIQKLLAKKRIPPHLEALQAFDDLKKRELLKKGLIKEFYYELSYILRRYIGGRFKIFADKQTTEEFLQQLLQNNPFDKMAEQILRDFADLADTVKYSLFRPDIQLGEESFQIAKSFVDNTKPSAEESEQ